MLKNTTSSGTKPATTERKNKSYMIVLLLLIAIILNSLFLPFFNIEKIIVTNNIKINEQDIIVSSGINMGINIFRTSLKAARSHIETIPYIQKAEVTRVLPNQILIEVTERRPVGYVPFMGAYILIDESGCVLEVNTTLCEGKLPIIKGLGFNQFKIGDTINVDDRKKLTATEVCIKALVKNEVIMEISEIDLQDINNIELEVGKTIKVNLGSKENAHYKMMFLKEILQTIPENQKGYIDLSLEKPVFIPAE